MHPPILMLPRLDHLIGEGLPEPVPVPVASASSPLFEESTPVEPADVEPVRQAPTGQGWEAALGGSWLNKIGVLLVVVGLVLFIRYSFGMLGPAGRVAVSVAVSASMLTAGAVLERREKYRVAARGLIGGGWAGLYATTFAAHAIEAARVIDKPDAGHAAAGRGRLGDGPALAAIPLADGHGRGVLRGVCHACHHATDGLCRRGAGAPGSFSAVSCAPLPVDGDGARGIARDLRDLHAARRAELRGKPRAGPDGPARLLAGLRRVRSLRLDASAHAKAATPRRCFR